MGCRLRIERVGDDDMTVTGNRCVRGEQYARAEILSPKRVVTATCRAANIRNDAEAPRRIPLRTAKAFPKEKVAGLLSLIYALELELPVHRGQVAIADALGTGIDVIVTRTM